jgi:hypothetical protein
MRTIATMAAQAVLSPTPAGGLEKNVVRKILPVLRRTVIGEHPRAVWEPYCGMHHSTEEQLIDDETRHRREISKRLIQYAGEISSLIQRLSEVLELPSLTEPQVVAIESFTERIGSLNETIRRTVNAEDAPLPYEQSLASTDRLREEIATANLFLDRLLLDPRGN